MKLALSVSLLGLVIAFVDFDEALNLIAGADPWYLVPWVFLIQADRLLMAYKWNLLLGTFGARVPLFPLFRMYTAALLAGFLMPSSIGGDVFRLYALSRYGIESKAILSSMIVEKAIGFVAVLAFGAVGLCTAAYLLRDDWASLSFAIWGLAFGAIVVGVMFGSMHESVRRRVDKLTRRVSSDSIWSKVHGVYVQLAEYRNHRRVLVTFTAWTFFEQWVALAMTFLTARALHIDVSFAEMVAIVPLILIGARMPISLDGIGVQEALFVVLFGLVGVSAAEAFLMSALIRVVVAVSALPWGIHYVLGARKHQIESDQ